MYKNRLQNLVCEFTSQATFFSPPKHLSLYDVIKAKKSSKTLQTSCNSHLVRALPPCICVEWDCGWECVGG